jgi:hypothetical protein
MLKLAFLAMTLLSSPPAVPVVNVAHFILFKFEEWMFSCEVRSDRLSSCSARKSFGDIEVLLEGRDGVAVSVSGGCPAGGDATVDVVEEVLRNDQGTTDPRQVRAIAAARINARRAACGQPRLSEEDQEIVGLAAILLIQVKN